MPTDTELSVLQINEESQEMNQAKIFLQQYENWTNKANDYREEYEKELEMIDAIRSSSDNDGMPHGTNISRPVEDRALRLSEKAAQWKMAELDALEARQRVFDVIMKIDGTERKILYLRYVKLLKWEEVCFIVDLEWTQTHFYHNKGLAAVEKFI